MKTKTAFLIAVVMATCAALPLMADRWYDRDTGFSWMYGYIDSRCADLRTDNVAGNIYEPAIISPEPKGSVMVPFMVGNVKYDLNRIVTSLGWCAFYQCLGLTSVTVHDGVTEIGMGAFNTCTGLRTVTIGRSVRSIGDYAFYRCFELERITFLGDAPEVGVDAFDKVPSTCTVYVQKESTGWGDVPGVWNGLNVKYDDTSFSEETIGSAKWSYRIKGEMAEVYPGAHDQGNGIKWALYDRANGATVTIPSVLGGKPVTSIGYRSFFEYGDNYGSREYYVIIPDGVMSIGREAFFNSKLETVSLPDSLVHIGARAFMYCQRLAHVTIPDVVKCIGDKAFYHCEGLKSVTFLGDAPELGEDAFSNVNAACKVYVQRGSKGWGVSIPGKWNGLDIAYDSINSKDSGGYTWSYRNLDEGGIDVCSGTDAAAISPSPTGTVKIPRTLNGDYVVCIGRNAFRGCSEMTSVKIDDSYGCVYEIGRYAFRDCSGLTSVTIPTTVKSIASYAFYGCDGLKKITFDGNAPETGKDVFSGVPSDCVVYVYKNSVGWGVDIPGKWKGLDIRYYADETSDGETLEVEEVDGYSWSYFIKDGTAHIYRDVEHSAVEPYPSGAVITIPSTLGGKPVTEVGDYALGSGISYDDGVEGAAGVNIPDSVTRIGAYAFAGCYFEGITIPGGVTNIGDNAFADCIKLKSVTIPDSVTRIGSEAFHKCIKLESATIGRGVESLGSSVFIYCSAMKSITFLGNAPKLDSNNTLFSGCYATIYVPVGSTGWGVDIPGKWQGLNIEYSPPDYVWTYRTTAEGAEIYNNGSCAVSPKPSGAVAIPSMLGGRPVTAIGDYAICDCDNLTEVTLPGSVTSIGRDAFNDCDKLTSVTLPGSVTSIGRNAFYSCNKLASVNIPVGVTSVGMQAFSYCANALYDTETVPGALVVDGWIVGKSGNPTSLVLPEGVRGIADYALRECYNLASMTIPKTLKNIGRNALPSKTYLLKTVYVASGDEVRVKEMMEASGFDTEGVAIIPPDAYIIAFEPGVEDAEGATPRQVVVIDKVAKLNPCTYIAPAGKRFTGWRRVDTGRRYDDGVLVFNLAGAGEVVTLTAIWE